MIASLLMAGCAEVEPAPVPSTECVTARAFDDADGDGFGNPTTMHDACAGDGAIDGTDCDDADSTIYPGAVEPCGDAVDRNCDGVTVLGDADGDGSDVCSDCDDANPDVHPGSVETCSTATDDDCDGDTNDRDAAGCTDYFLDGDGDGYGSTSRICLCSPDGAWTASSDDDCDDGEPEAHPSAAERWGNDLDDDCDGATDSQSVSEADLALVGEETYDEAGYALDGAGDVNGDGHADVVVGAWGAVDTYIGAAYVVFGPRSGEVDLGLADARLFGSGDLDHAGYAVAGGGDADGDGLDDVLVGAFGASDVEEYGGSAALVLGGTITGDLILADSTTRWTGGLGYRVGYAVDFAGDVDGDGRDDLLIGGKGGSVGSVVSGAVWLALGPGASGDVDESSSSFAGQEAGDGTGTAVTGAGDLDGDGLADVAFGVPLDDEAGVSAGAVFVVFGSSGSAPDLSNPDAAIFGAEDGDLCGGELDGGGDADGDGYDDLIVVADGWEDIVGAVFVFRGPLSPSADLTSAGAILASLQPADLFAVSVALVANVRGDGRSAVAVGASGVDTLDGEDVEGAGAAYLFFDPVGTVDSADADASLRGVARGEQVGWEISHAGDWDGDGLGDLLIGAPGGSRTMDNSGVAYLFLSPLP